MTNYTISSKPNFNSSAKSNMIAIRDDKLAKIIATTEASHGNNGFWNSP